MKLTIQRNQSAGSKGRLVFSSLFHLALLPKEQELVRLYGLSSFVVVKCSEGGVCGTPMYTVQQLVQGARYDSLASSEATRYMPRSAVEVSQALHAEADVKRGCQALLRTFSNLDNFAGKGEFIYEDSEDVGDE